MHLYTLTPGFMPKDIISEFISAIWTERYSEAGDVQLVVPATSDMIEKLAQGTFLALQGTKEIMILDTHSIEEGLLTVTGQSLLKFLDERPAWFENTDTSSDQAIVALTQDTTAGELISSAVYQMVIDPPGYTGPATYLNLNWGDEVIPGLELGRVDANGYFKRLTLNVGTLYSSIQSLAQEEGVGLKLYLESARATTGPVFKFATYRGKNRTTDQDVHAIVRLTPKMDSLTDVKEISSSANYKNVVYVVYKGMTIHYAEPSLPIPQGFERRVLVVQPDDIYLEETRYEEYREQVARDAFANNNYVHTVDGQASPQGIYQYREDYGLGDIIELEGLTGTLSKARITEYIRTQDQAGEREYPTLSVVDHLSTGTIPDTEPDDIPPPGDGDPDIDDDIPDPDPDPPEDPDDPDTPDPDPNPDPDPFPPDTPPGPGDGDGDGDGDGPGDPPPIILPAPGDEWPPGEDDGTYIVPPPSLPTYSAPGYWTVTVKWEGDLSFSAPPDDFDPTWPHSDYFIVYDRLLRLVIGGGDYLHDDTWLMPGGMRDGTPIGGYVVYHEDISGNPSWPHVRVEITYVAGPYTAWWYRIPAPGFMPPSQLQLWTGGSLRYHVNNRYMGTFIVQEGYDVDGSWSAPISPENVQFIWQYHKF